MSNLFYNFCNSTENEPFVGEFAETFSKRHIGHTMIFYFENRVKCNPIIFVNIVTKPVRVYKK